MNRRALSIVLVALVGLCASSAARAERVGAEVINVKVDFPFRAGQETLPAGAYVVRHPTGDMAVIELVGEHDKTTVLVAISRLARSAASYTDETGLIFRKVDGQLVLSEVWLQDLDGFLMRREDEPSAGHHGQTTKK